MTKPVKRKGLGKGLQALIPQINTTNIVEEALQEDRVQIVDINSIYPNENQPRKQFHQEALQELAESIEKYGLIQPIVVTEKEKGFMIIAGERRWRATRIAGLKEIPCIIKKYTEQQLMEVAIIENIQREDLNIIDEGRAYKYLIDRYQVTQDQLAEAVGKSRPYIANILRLLQLDPRIIDMIKEGKLTGGHGRALLSIQDLEKQYEVALKVEKEDFNVRQVEELVRNMTESSKKSKEITKKKDFQIFEIEENLKNFFGTKVTITNGKKKGKIEIEYYNEGDLERILSLLEANE
ncbi:ParB/RepB/Spo0J family partition protein [Clostridium formicaceticum]|jgi:ParB family chromosome partitioning protein|uniref:Chromosome-partitioning protein ParB n=1 Tax=Clostridium formicaceticum TaxID=1497 RepID=A0AAC9RRY2_9CLOT|nr:ParB/RepB/Spo0J family partition protein [Clostridium formicaceticum]AOY75404.1 chromosome partitioning protein ParB [Clostridium formicaceticum]ARE89860.1 putative chromosome-partitioning protein ParB [Clostridium formicaceticum]